MAKGAGKVAACSPAARELGYGTFDAKGGEAEAEEDGACAGFEGGGGHLGGLSVLGSGEAGEEGRLVIERTESRREAPLLASFLY